MPKLPYEYVARYVDELYEYPLNDSSEEEIVEHCEFIREFINACGWDEDELLRVMHDNKSQMLHKELDKLN